MAHANRLSRGDVRRNARLDRLRRVVSRDHAVLAVDLADDTQVVVVCDHDSRVLARRTWRCRPCSWIGRWGGGWRWRAGTASPAWWLPVNRPGTAGGWWSSRQQAGAGGRLRAAAAGAPGPRGRGLHPGQSDDKDALLIARLTTQLHCYLPERPTAAWARLRHLGNRRVEQLTLATAAQQRLRDLLECGWPAALEVTRHPLDSLTWRAAMTVGRCDPARIRRLGLARFARAVARELPRWGGRRRNLGILRALYAATGDDRGVTSQRAGALERSALVLADFKQALAALVEVEGRMATCSASSAWPSW